MIFFRRLFYLFYFYPQVLWIYYKLERRLALPYRFNSWHHRTIYLYNKDHFIKSYLDKGRGLNESYIHGHLSAKKFVETPKLLKFFESKDLEVLIFHYIHLKCGVTAVDSELIENRLKKIGVSHGDLKKNIFYNDAKPFVIDFAFSKVNGEFLHKEIPEKYLSERVENLTGKILFFGTGSNTLSEILDTISIGNCFHVSFNRNFLERLVLNFLASLSSKYFTKYIIRKYGLKKYHVELLVFFDFPNALKLDVQYLKTLVPKVFLYYWNPVNNIPRLNQEIEVFDDVWSFSSYDCKTYNLKYNGQFYKVKNSFCTLSGEFDIFYVGRIKKDREILLAKYISLLEERKISLKILLIGRTENIVLKKYLSNFLTYSDVIKHIRNSRAVLDISSADAGLSLRPLEALFYDKKIISNINLSNFSSGFNTENMFCLESDSFEEIESFLESNFCRTEINFFNDRFSVNRFVMEFLNV